MRGDAIKCNTTTKLDGTRVTGTVMRGERFEQPCTEITGGFQSDIGILRVKECIYVKCDGQSSPDGTYHDAVGCFGQLIRGNFRHESTELPPAYRILHLIHVLVTSIHFSFLLPYSMIFCTLQYISYRISTGRVVCSFSPQ